jgi:type II secretory pathway component PulF
VREFRYKALTASGQTIDGIRRAPSAEELAAELFQQGLIVLKSRATLGSFGSSLSAASRAGRRELRDFTQHMATCLAAGIPAVAALADFQAQLRGAFASVLADIRGDVSSGTQLDEAFGKHPEVFGDVYLALLAAGQNSGSLDQSFRELADYLEWQDDLRGRAQQALIYPAILLVGVTGLFFLLGFFVIPRFQGIFEDVDFELPALTRNVLAFGDWLGHWGWLVILVAFGVVAAARIYRGTEQGRYQTDALLLKLPVVGGFVRKLALSRFAKNFALLFASGLDLLRLLDLLERAVGNRVLASQVAAARRRVATGESLHESFADADAIPHIIKRLIAVGEKTGSLDQSLMRASEAIDKELPRALQRAFTLFEVLVVFVLGVLVCIAALSLLMPIMQIRAQVGH